MSAVDERVKIDHAHLLHPLHHPTAHHKPRSGSKAAARSSRTPTAASTSTGSGRPVERQCRPWARRTGRGGPGADAHARLHSSYAGATNRAGDRAGRKTQRARVSVDQHVLLHQRRRRGQRDVVQDRALLLEGASASPTRSRSSRACARYHGVTLAAMSATGLPAFWPMFEPRVPGFLHIEAPYPYRFVNTDPAREPRRGGGEPARGGDPARRPRDGGGVHRRAGAGRRRRDRAARRLLPAHPRRSATSTTCC